MTAAARNRAYRSRRKAGLVVLRVSAPDTLALTLIEGGLLARCDEENKSAVERAVEQLLANLAAVDLYSR